MPKSRIYIILITIISLVILIFYRMKMIPYPSIWADYSVNNNLIVTTNNVSNSSTVLNIWDIQNGQHLAQIGTSDYSSEALFSSDGKYLISFAPNQASSIYVYSTTNWELAQNISYPSAICDIEISPDVMFVMVCGYDRNVVFLEAIGDGDKFIMNNITTFETTNGKGEQHIALNPSFSKILISTNSNYNSTFEIWDIISYNTLNTTQLSQDITSVEWLNEEFLIVASTENHLTVLNSVTLEIVSEIICPFSVTSMDVSHDGTLLIAAGEGGTILYRISDMQELTVLEPTSVTSARFNSMGTHVLVASSRIHQPYLEINISNFIFND